MNTEENHKESKAITEQLKVWKTEIWYYFRTKVIDQYPSIKCT